MKTLALVLFGTLLIGCNEKLVASKGLDKESVMLSAQQGTNCVISSPMDGVLLKDGQPVAHAKIVRRLRWNGSEQGLFEEFSTDAQGRFSIPLHEEKLSLGKLTQFVAKNDMSVEVENNSYDIWYSNKFEPEIFSETGGQIKMLICDLTETEVTVRSGASKVSTICRWEDMPNPEF